MNIWRPSQRRGHQEELDVCDEDLTLRAPTEEPHHQPTHAHSQQQNTTTTTPETYPYTTISIHLPLPPIRKQSLGIMFINTNAIAPELPALLANTLQQYIK